MRSKHFLILALLFSSVSLFVLQVIAFLPHFLVIVLDDLGWSDVRFHDSQINSPDIQIQICFRRRNTGLLLCTTNLLSNQRSSPYRNVPYTYR